MVGFDAKNITNIRGIYHCSICFLILRNPVQLVCGHRQCKSCVESKLDKGIIKCSVCQEETQQSEVMLDTGLGSDMEFLHVTCSLCNWEGLLKDYEVRRIVIDERCTTEHHQDAITAFLNGDPSQLVTNQPTTNYEKNINNLFQTNPSLFENSNTKSQKLFETINTRNNGLSKLSKQNRFIPQTSKYFTLWHSYKENTGRRYMRFFSMLTARLNNIIVRAPFDSGEAYHLRNQTSVQRYIIDSFRLDLKSDNFRRPPSGMNIATGTPRFCPMPILQREQNLHVQNDTLFIRTMVDFSNLPKPLLPNRHALCLNPGLPVRVQRSLIRKELEQRTPRKLTKQEREQQAKRSLIKQELERRAKYKLRFRLFKQEEERRAQENSIEQKEEERAQPILFRRDDGRSSE
ncbi:unnamed protein product [Adineta steineri]|uniref:RING-type domain-containing protein n=1 Tax=Adineta steineri TaxID=433720 RepID=A0A816B9V6_9BILA|nr:unnamed protein product [Adineta steineri]CAF1607691.1 unnamed protein product [Adineta steineri]